MNLKYTSQEGNPANSEKEALQKRMNAAKS